MERERLERGRKGENCGKRKLWDGRIKQFGETKGKRVKRVVLSQEEVSEEVRRIEEETTSGASRGEDR